MAGFLYRHSDRIVAVTPAFQDHLVAHWRVPERKISVVQNGVETGLFRPHTVGALRQELCAQERFVVAYIGTMGMAHGLETLVEAATRIQATAPQVLFLLVGEGADKERIMSLAHSRNLSNLRFIGQQPRERIPDYICAADACLVLLKKTDVFKTVIPTKMLEFMSCGLPVILAVDGQARKTECLSSRKMSMNWQMPCSPWPPIQAGEHGWELMAVAMSSNTFPGSKQPRTISRC
jgi:glycosyltransferase involved in cell wall biosynthesis